MPWQEFQSMSFQRWYVAWGQNEQRLMTASAQVRDRARTRQVQMQSGDICSDGGRELLRKASRFVIDNSSECDVCLPCFSLPLPCDDRLHISPATSQSITLHACHVGLRFLACPHPFDEGLSRQLPRSPFHCQLVTSDCVFSLVHTHSTSTSPGKPPRNR